MIACDGDHFMLAQQRNRRVDAPRTIDDIPDTQHAVDAFSSEALQRDPKRRVLCVNISEESEAAHASG